MKEVGTASNFKSGQDLLDPGERTKAIARVQKAIRVAMLENAEDAAARVRRCPRCGSEAVVKKGVSKAGDQRYLCNDCKRTYGARTELVFCRSHLSKDVWMRYAECFVDQKTLRVCAKECGVSLKVAFTMRHRIIDLLSALDGPSSVVDKTN